MRTSLCRRARSQTSLQWSEAESRRCFVADQDLTVIITLMVFGPSIATATDHHMAARQRMNLADPQKTTMPSVPKAGTLCPTKWATALAWTYPNAVISTTEMLLKLG